MLYRELQSILLSCMYLQEIEILLNGILNH